MITHNRLIPFLFFMSSVVVSWMTTTCAVPFEASSSSKNTNIVSACQQTPYRAACEESFATFTPTTPPSDLFAHSLQFTIDKALSARALAYNLSLLSHRATSNETHINIHVNNVAIVDCLELLDDTLDLLSGTVITSKLEHRYHSTNIQTWLSAALTNQETCLESLQKYESKSEKGLMEVVTLKLSHFITNSLFLFMHDETNKEKSVLRGNGGSRRLLSDGSGSVFPEWVSVSERKLLEASMEEIGASAVVAKDGSGTHKTIREALEEVKMMGGGRSVIHVKAGTYNENLKIPTKQKNVMLVGDGKGKTVIVGNRNSKDGWTTFQSATVGVMGDGFMARDITFVNSAGPSKYQAVALRVGSDKSVIFRCSIVGFQDTLYTHSKRQFFRETDIYGTVDFIFGNSAVVFQNCNIFARKPLPAQHNFITAQGRTSPYQNTGISIHNCKITASSDLAVVKSKVATFLGRPWKEYSRTVIMQSYVDDMIHPSGWSPWEGSFALRSLYYGEYMNNGPGASTKNRVTWSGYHASLSSKEAQAFTVAGFIVGNLWLPSTGVSFDSGLLG